MTTQEGVVPTQEPVDGPAGGAECRQRDAGLANNPYMGRWASCYDALLSIPPIGQIRRSEERTLARLMASTLRPADCLLEIGPGTGRYTVQLASHVRRVTAVEQSAAMVGQLEARLHCERITNCAVVLGDFLELRGNELFDVVALIGVLDYVTSPREFLAAAARVARRALLFTIPRRGPLASAFCLCNRLRGIAIATCTPAEVTAYLPDFQVEVTETGLHTSLWPGMTLACRAVRG